jgi:hypothetical protein
MVHEVSINLPTFLEHAGFTSANIAKTKKIAWFLNPFPLALELSQIDTSEQELLLI